jgi:hypothetical protein
LLYDFPSAGEYIGVRERHALPGRQHMTIDVVERLKSDSEARNKWVGVYIGILAVPSAWPSCWQLMASCSSKPLARVIWPDLRWWG